MTAKPDISPEELASKLDRKTQNMIEGHAQMEDAAALLRALSAELEAQKVSWANNHLTHKLMEAHDFEQARAEALQEQIQEMIDYSEQTCGCGYDNPTDVCLGHWPAYKAMKDQLEATEAMLEGMLAWLNGEPSRPPETGMKKKNFAEMRAWAREADMMIDNKTVTADKVQKSKRKLNRILDDLNKR